MGYVPWEELLSLQCWGPAAKPGLPTAMTTPRPPSLEITAELLLGKND